MDNSLKRRKDRGFVIDLPEPKKCIKHEKQYFYCNNIAFWQPTIYISLISLGWQNRSFKRYLCKDMKETLQGKSVLTMLIHPGHINIYARFVTFENGNK